MCGDSVSIGDDRIDEMSPFTLVYAIVGMICDLMDRLDVLITADELALRFGFPQVEVMLRTLELRDSITTTERLELLQIAYGIDKGMGLGDHERIRLRLQLTDMSLVRKVADLDTRAETLPVVVGQITDDL
jgi:hypothetical protein